MRWSLGVLGIVAAVALLRPLNAQLGNPVTIYGIGPATVISTTIPISGTVTANAGSGTFPISGSVTANAGTNLNTSALALESGGNLASILTQDTASAAVLGVTTGAGVVTDANGTIQQYLRGLIKGLAAGTWSVVTTNAGIFAVQSTQAGSWTVTANAGTGNFGNNLTLVGGSAIALGTSTAANSLPVALPTATIATLTPPTAAAIGTSVSTDLLIGTQVAGSSVPVALPTTTITTLTPPTASAIGTAVAGGLLSGQSTIIACNKSTFLDMTSATTTQLVAASGSTNIYICSYGLEAVGTTTATFQYGTGTNCGTGTTQLGMAGEWVTQTGISRGDGLGIVFVTPATGQAVCLKNSAGVDLHVEITYAQF